MSYSPDLSNSLLSLLKCPVCFVYMVQPIRQCRRGHNICGECIRKVSWCTKCRSDFIETRNFSLEIIASKMDFPCKFRSHGCVIALRFDDLQRHNKVCRYGNRRCAMQNCSWQGPPAFLFGHMKQSHPTHILEKNSEYHCTLLKWDWLSSAFNGWLVFILIDLGELFWVHVKQDAASKTVTVDVQHVRSAIRDVFLYEVKFEGQVASCVYRSLALSDIPRINPLIVSGGSFFSTVGALKQFQTGSGDVVLKIKMEQLRAPFLLPGV